MIIKKVFIFLSLVFFVSVSAVTAFAQTGQKEGSSDTYVYMILAALLFTLAVLFASIMIFEAGERKPKKAKIVHTVSESELILKDHEYDGIFELDNPPPAWFQFLFYFTILFAVVYMLNYHVLGKNNSSQDEYAEEMNIAMQQREELIKTGALINENNVTLLSEAADLEKGKQIFTVNCVSCHGPDGGGTVGPNLTDDYWIHGGGIKNIFTTVKNGVPAKGMIAWQTQLNPKQMQEVSSYVISLKGTKPPSGKPPEGNLYTDSSSVGTNTADTTVSK